MGYRPVPGYTGYRFLSPALRAGTQRNGKSLRRYYNPAMSVNDPRREIGDNTYFALRKRMQAGTEEERIAVQRATQQNKDRANRRRRDLELDRLHAEGLYMDPDELALIRREVALIDYQHGNFVPRSERMPGGTLATLLEELGWRPRGAPWMVGESGLDHSRTAPGVNPQASMIQWKSQSTTRGRVA